MPRINQKKQGRKKQTRPRIKVSAMKKLQDKLDRLYKPHSKDKYNSYPFKPSMKS